MDAQKGIHSMPNQTTVHADGRPTSEPTTAFPGGRWTSLPAMPRPGDTITVHLVMFRARDGRAWTRAYTYDDPGQLTERMHERGAIDFTVMGTFEMREGCGHTVTEYDYDRNGQRIESSRVVITY